MRQPIFTPNIPINEKRIAHIEHVILQLMRRSVRKTSALITPYPISSASFGDNVKGRILCYMFPCEGIITKGMISFGSRPLNGANLTISYHSRDYSASRTFTLHNIEDVVEPKVKVESGGKVIVEIFPKEGTIIKEVWISFLWTPSVREVEVKSYLIDELDHTVEEVQKELEDEGTRAIN